ncbi:MAG: acetate--CoA ligase family protein [Candidatus Helarchaeota archaeon]
MPRNLTSFLNAKSIAVIGASKTKGKVGHAILKNIIDFGFQGAIYPINLKESEILGLKCYPTVLDVKEKIDLAIFAIPAKACLKVTRECGQKGVQNAIFITAGFKEIGIEGAQLERELLSICQEYDINALGPNCVGYIDTQNKLNASFTNVFPLSGGIALISQSGAIITSSIDWSIPQYLGFSKIFSLGNKMDLNEIDFLEALMDDPNTKVILMYLESIEEGEKFVKTAQKACQKKPIIVLKAGISEAGARAASSHTGALAGSKIAYSTAFKKCGIIQAENLEDLFNYGLALSSRSKFRSDSLIIITNAGGAGILATDATEKYGLRLRAFSAAESNILKSNLPYAASVHNPIDILGDAGADRYKFVLETCMNFEGTPAFVVLMSPQAMTEFKETTDVLIDFTSRNPEIPLIISYMGGISPLQQVQRLRKQGIPCFTFPHAAIRSMAGIFGYSCVVEREKEEYEQFEVNSELVQKIFNQVLNDNRLVLLENEATQVAHAYGLPAPPAYLAKTADDAIQFANKMGYPVVLKIASPEILHKSDLGGIILNIRSSEEVRSSFNEIIRRVIKRMPGARIYGVTIQKMVQKRGKELIIGANRDPQFGYLIMCGLGGIYVNFLQDVAFRLHPITRFDAQEMISETKAYKLLKGVRGEAPSDINKLIDTLLRISQLLADHPVINELDINPIHIYSEKEGVNILDMKITLLKKKE